MGSRRGFTLLEVLVATAILGLILMAVYGVVARTLMATQRAESRAELYADGRELVLRLADEIEGALPPSTTVYFLGERREATPPSDVLQFFTVVRRVYGAEQRAGGMALVGYMLDETETPKVFALRRQEEVLAVAGGGGDPNAPGMGEAGAQFGAANDAPEEPQVRAIHLSDRVAGLRFDYVDPATGEAMPQWDTSQPGPDNELLGLPAAVSITLWLWDENGSVHDFSTIVDLPLARFPTPTR